MKKTFIKIMAVSVLILGGSQATSCKKKTEPTVETPVATTEPEIIDTVAAAPVEIASDDQLVSDVKDAVKDFPGVTAAVNNGEITLTGDITRERLPKLMQGLHALHPKKINNNLTVTK